MIKTRSQLASLSKGRGDGEQDQWKIPLFLQFLQTVRCPSFSQALATNVEDLKIDAKALEGNGDGPNGGCYK